MSDTPFFVLIGCEGCGGTGRTCVGSEYTVPCLRCHGGACTWHVDLTEAVGADPVAFVDLYGSFLPDQAAEVTDYACLHGFTWHEVECGAPAWLALPEGPGRTEFEEERAGLRERAPLAKTYPVATEAKRSA